MATRLARDLYLARRRALQVLLHSSQPSLEPQDAAEQSAGLEALRKALGILRAPEERLRNSGVADDPDFALYATVCARLGTRLSMLTHLGKGKSHLQISWKDVAPLLYEALAALTSAEQVALYVREYRTAATDELQQLDTEHARYLLERTPAPQSTLPGTIDSAVATAAADSAARIRSEAHTILMASDEPAMFSLAEMERQEAISRGELPARREELDYIARLGTAQKRAAEAESPVLSDARRTRELVRLLDERIDHLEQLIGTSLGHATRSLDTRPASATESPSGRPNKRAARSPNASSPDVLGAQVARDEDFERFITSELSAEPHREFARLNWYANYKTDSSFSGMNVPETLRIYELLRKYEQQTRTSPSV